MADEASLRDLIEGLGHVMVWLTNKEGAVVSAWGGGLRLLGLTQSAVVNTSDSTWGDLSRLHREAMMGLSGIDRVPGTAFVRTAHNRTFVICWSPYFDTLDNKLTPVGLAAFFVDVTSLENTTVQRLESKMDEVIPYIRSVAEAEVERLKAETRLKTQAEEAIATDKEHRWEFMSSFGTWFKERATWFSERIGYPLTVLVTVLVLWLAQKLNVHLPEVRITPDGTPTQISAPK